MFDLLQDGSDGISYQLTAPSDQQPYTAACSGSSQKAISMRYYASHITTQSELRLPVDTISFRKE
jgi:hypothetical protein